MPFGKYTPTLISSFSSAALTIDSGAGPIGLVTLLAARAAGCTPIVITDLFPSRLEFAKKLLPTVKTVQIEKTAKPEEVAKQIKGAAGMQLSLAFDCTGVESSIRSAIFVSPCLKDIFTVSNTNSIALTVCQVWRQSLCNWCRTFRAKRESFPYFYSHHE